MERQASPMALPKQRTTETMSVSEARRHFSDALDRVRRDDVRIVVEKSGIPVAAVVPISVLEDDEGHERRRQEAIASLRAAHAGFVGVPEDEIEREIAEALEEVKQETKMARTIATALIRANPELFSMSEESLVSEVKRLIRIEAGRSGKEAAPTSGETA
jgi:prevent-host-death family protein